MINKYFHVNTRRKFIFGFTSISAISLCSCTSLSQNQFSEVDSLARAAIKTHKAPGIVLAVGHDGKIVHKYVYGHRALTPTQETMTWDTHFDMASLTKPCMTALSILQLYEKKLIDIDDPVVKYLPEFSDINKNKITLRLLLTHYSGLPPDISLTDKWIGKNSAFQRIMDTSLINTPGDKFVYSDINFIILGFIVEKVSHMSLSDYVYKNILLTMNMTQSGYLPDTALRSIIAPTQYDDRGILLRGIVHDPTARRMGGVAGNAGFFSDAHDMCLYAQALLDRLAGRPSLFPLSRAMLKLMVSPQQPEDKKDLRGLGWDIKTRYSTPNGDVFSSNSFGHTGFTGTSLWIDPDNDSYILILTNRVHPNGSGNVVKLRYDIARSAFMSLNIN